MSDDSPISLGTDYVPSTVKQLSVKVNKPLAKGNYVLKILNKEGKEFGFSEFKVFEEFGGIVDLRRIDTSQKVFIFLVVENRLNQQISADFEVWLPPEVKSNEPLFTKSEIIKEGLCSVTIELDKNDYGTLEVPLVIRLKSKEELIEPDSDKREVYASRQAHRPITSTSNETNYEGRVKKARLAGLFTDRASTW